MTIQPIGETMKDKTRNVNLPDPAYQPSKAELNENIQVDAPGRNIMEQMNNAARAITRPAKIQYRKKR